MRGIFGMRWVSWFSRCAVALAVHCSPLSRALCAFSKTSQIHWNFLLAGRIGRFELATFKMPFWCLILAKTGCFKFLFLLVLFLLRTFRWASCKTSLLAWFFWLKKKRKDVGGRFRQNVVHHKLIWAPTRWMLRRPIKLCNAGIRFNFNYCQIYCPIAMCWPRH